MSTGSAPRVVAARVLDAVLHRGRSLKAELAAQLPTLDDPRDRALVEAICFAVLRQPARFEAAVKTWVPRPLGRRDDELRALLYAGFAQLDPLALPPHAAVAATVEAARAMGRAHQAGMANALLRRAQREGLPPGDPAAHWPQWLRTCLQQDWPQDHTRILEASAQTPPMWLRVNRLQQSREVYRERLLEAGIASHPDAAAPDALRVDGSVAVAQLPGFAEGAVSVQDISAQFVADALALPSGARVLDACAAPGGKSAHLLERDPALKLVALDVDDKRLDRVRSTLARLGLPAAQLRSADASRLETWWDGTPLDAVLIDAPCSATGIVRRQPDVLLHRRESDVTPLLATQAHLLDALWSTLAPGGVLLYATCSVLKAENEGQVDAFLARTADARVDALDERFGRPSGAGRQRLPGEQDGDGFFYARLRKLP
ncbi:16S rRNA (cytosine(967)-C(5))-methyltransferase RsmB [Lysobacter terrae]